MIGFASFEYSASTQCAIEFMPLVAESIGGMLTVSVGSYSTVFGSTRGSRPVFFKPPSVIPQMGVISDPA